MVGAVCDFDRMIINNDLLNRTQNSIRLEGVEMNKQSNLIIKISLFHCLFAGKRDGFVRTCRVRHVRR